MKKTLQEIAAFVHGRLVGNAFLSPTSFIISAIFKIISVCF